MKWSLLLLSIVILINAGGPASVNFKTDTKKIIMAEAEARPRLDTFMDRPRVAPGRTNFNKTLLSSQLHRDGNDDEDQDDYYYYDDEYGDDENYKDDDQYYHHYDGENENEYYYYE